MNEITTLKNMVNYCHNTPILKVDCETLEDFIIKNEYHGHPDEECQWESAMRGDLEVYLETCMDIQERYNNLWETLELLGNDRVIESFECMEKITEMMQKYYTMCM